MPAQSGMLSKEIKFNHMEFDSSHAKTSSKERERKTYNLFDSKYKAMAVPMTSCISDPMMAISVMIHRISRGNVLYCL